jgi:hypothetical protein
MSRWHSATPLGGRSRSRPAFSSSGGRALQPAPSASFASLRSHRALVDVDSEDAAQRAVGERLVAHARFGGRAADRLRDQLRRIDAAQQEEELGTCIEARSYAVHGSRDVLAHGRPIRTGARQRDLGGAREDTPRLVGHDLHDPVRELALKQLDQRVHLPRAIARNRVPARLRERLHVELDGVHARPANERLHLSAGDVEVHDRAVPCVGASAGETVLVVAV